MARWRSGAHQYGVAEFMPADGEEFERDDHQSYAWDSPQTKEHDRIDDYLSIRLENTEAEKGERRAGVGDPLRRAQTTGRKNVRYKRKRGGG
jgi:hypothetical protein